MKLIIAAALAAFMLAGCDTNQQIIKPGVQHCDIATQACK